MPNLLPAPYDNMFMLFFFIYVRVSAVIYLTPVLNNMMVPRPVQAGIAFWIAVILIGPTWGLHQAAMGPDIPAVTHAYHGLLDFSFAIMGEVMIGIALSFIATILLQTMEIAGEIIGQQSGFSAASVFDPLSGQDIFLMAQINTMMGMMFFILIDGPGTVLSVMADSFQILKPGEGVSIAQYTSVTHALFSNSEGTERQLALGSIMFKVGIQIAAPMTSCMMMVNISEALLSKAVPQLNITVVGFAVRIVMSLIVLIYSMEHIATTFTHYLRMFPQYGNALIHNLGSP